VRQLAMMARALQRVARGAGCVVQILEQHHAKHGGHRIHAYRDALDFTHRAQRLVAGQEEIITSSSPAAVGEQARRIPPYHVASSRRNEKINGNR